MKITICIGSSCHLKGSRQIVEELQRLVKENQLGDKVELAGELRQPCHAVLRRKSLCRKY